MSKILISGAGGQLGQSFKKLQAKYPALEMHFFDRNQLDITNEEQVNTLFEEQQADYFINCAAYTAVDKAEKEKEKAFNINAKATESLAIACKKHKLRLVHFSTDYVYHNDQSVSFTENDDTHPQSVYAESKKAGEDAILQHHKESIILRTSWLWSEFEHNFVKTMLRLGAERDQIKVVNDQIGCPTYAPDLADAVLRIIIKITSGEVDKEAFAGIYNYSNQGVASWYDFARAIFDIKAFKCKLGAIPSSSYPTPAKRPPFSLMNLSKIESTFGLYIPYWRHSLEQTLRGDIE